MIESIDKIVKLLEKEVGHSGAVIWSADPYHVLVSTVLSQRTRDENTHKASQELFKIYDTPSKLAKAPLGKIKSLIKSTGFYNAKASNIKELSKIILEKYDGKVPEDMDDLLSLPGVGRKTANCVLVYGFNTPAIPVDTHVHRISNRIGWVSTKTPEETEAELTKKIPRKYWIKINNLLVKFGQKTCQPIKPKCSNCPLQEYCRYYLSITRNNLA